jgi:hypothetical protein
VRSASAYFRLRNQLFRLPLGAAGRSGNTGDAWIGGACPARIKEARAVARAALTVTNISVAVASTKAPTTSARMIGA